MLWCVAYRVDLTSFEVGISHVLFMFVVLGGEGEGDHVKTPKLLCTSISPHIVDFGVKGPL